jgi:hypothetical protein
MVEHRQRVRLAPAKLGDEREHRGRLAGLTRQPPQHHAGVLAQGAGKAGVGEEFGRLPIVLGRRPGDDLFEGNGEFVGIERAPFPDFLPWGDGSVPGLHQ